MTLYTYFDWITHAATLAYLLFLAEDYASETGRVVGVVVLTLIFYRGFSLLRIFDAFITLVGIINIIIFRLLAFFGILLYAYFAVGLLMLKLDNADRASLRFQDVYYWVFLGSVEGEAFDVEFSYLAIVFGSLFITIVMLNILIAFLSNLFSRLEDQQKVNSLRQKALLVLDFELFARLFRFRLSGLTGLATARDALFAEHALTDKELHLAEVSAS